MKKGQLSIYLLCLLYFTPLIYATTSEGSCIVKTEILDVEDDDDIWLVDYDDNYDYDTTQKNKKINYAYSILCDNVILNPELTLQSQISGDNKQHAYLSTVITLKNTKLTTVSAALLKDMTAAARLDFSNSSISTIEPGSLNLEKLEKIDLQHNNISEIKEDTFKNLNNLKEIYLGFNKIKTFESPKNCNELERLELQNNIITTIKENHFKNIESLRYLNLSNNNISTVHSSAFATLRELDLSYNQLQEASFENFEWSDPGSIKHWWLIFLKKLNLSYNNLTSIPKYLNKTENLSVILLLNNNNIARINVDDLMSLNLTRYLFLENNKIDTIEMGSFRDLRSLGILDLSLNKIKEINPGVFTGLNNLQYLNLSYNEIIHFDATVFVTMQSLKEINFRGNYLHSLNTSEFHFQSLQFISLDFHQISCHTLSKYIKAFKSHGIEVREGSTMFSENVHGIGCIHTNHTKTTTTVSPTTTTVTPTTTTIKSTTLPSVVSTTVVSTTAVTEHNTVVPDSSTESNVTGKSANVQEPQTSKTSHTVLIITIVFLLTLLTGIAVWVGKKYYHKRYSNSDNESQYSLVNILEETELYK